MVGYTCLTPGGSQQAECRADASEDRMQARFVDMALPVELGSPKAYYSCDSDVVWVWDPAPAVCFEPGSAGAVAVQQAGHWCFAGSTHRLGSPDLSRSLSFDVTMWAGVRASCVQSRCFRMNVTRAEVVGLAEERWESRRCHCPGWRYAGRPAIARDSGRQT